MGAFAASINVRDSILQRRWGRIRQNLDLRGTSGKSKHRLAVLPRGWTRYCRGSGSYRVIRAAQGQTEHGREQANLRACEVNIHEKTHGGQSACEYGKSN